MTPEQIHQIASDEVVAQQAAQHRFNVCMAAGLPFSGQRRPQERSRKGRQ